MMVKTSGIEENKKDLLPEYLKSRLIMFFTVDIVGSTAYKQKHISSPHVGDISSSTEINRKSKLHPKWHSPLAEFYNDTPSIFSEQWESIKKEQESIGDAPSFWKAIGDEVGFTKRLTKADEVIAGLLAWRNTLFELKNRIQKHSPDLDVKSAVWLAGFPITNTEVVFLSKNQLIPNLRTFENSDDDFVYSSLARLKLYYQQKNKSSSDGESFAWVQDFVGPSIDTGFRISTKATPRKLVLSIELVYLLADYCCIKPKTTTNKSPKHNSLEAFAKQLISALCFDGRESFKGVMGGVPYPIFWIDQDQIDPESSEFNRYEQSLQNNKSLSQDEVKGYCNSFIEKFSRYINKPYILNESELVYGEVPEVHEQRLQQLKEVLQWFDEQTAQNEIEETAISNPDSAGYGADEIDKDKPLVLK